ncbi:MAG: pilus assembly protein [Planctomycetes bacterium]|nr:pilus assembly protein [Planctomycetota bacterium]
MNMRFSRKCQGRGLRRRGVAAAEFAVCLPVIMLIVLAMIESCTMIFLKQSLTVASYEGIRTALEERAVATDVLGACQQVLTDRRVQGGTITIQPNNFETLLPGEFIQVTVSAPADSNSVVPGSFFGGRTLTATATMMKEL